MFVFERKFKVGGNPVHGESQLDYGIISMGVSYPPCIIILGFACFSKLSFNQLFPSCKENTHAVEIFKSSAECKICTGLSVYPF